MTLSRSLVAASGTALLTILVAALLAVRADPRPDPVAGAPASTGVARGGEVPVEQRPAVRAAAVLRAWDVRRARAWAAGDPRALRRLYTSGSAAGRRDLAMLAAWNRRGLRVRGLRVQLVAVEVRVAERDRLRLRVADRLVGGWVGAGADRVRLPADRRSRRTVELRRGSADRVWRVHSVRSGRSAQDRPARSTASTWRSRTS